MVGRNWARGVDEDRPPIALKESCSPEAPRPLSPALAFGRFAANPARASGQLCSHKDMPVLFWAWAPYPMPHLCSADLGLLRNAHFNTYQNSDKGLTDAN